MAFHTFVFICCFLSSLSMLCDGSVPLNVESRSSVHSSDHLKNTEDNSHADLPDNVGKPKKRCSCSDDFYGDKRTTVETSSSNVQEPIVETTPSVCASVSACAFQVIDPRTMEAIGDLIKYCDCPAGQECRYVSVNTARTRLRYKCMDVNEHHHHEVSLSAEPIMTSTAEFSENENTGTTDISIQERIGLLHYPDDL